MVVLKHNLLEIYQKVERTENPDMIDEIQVQLRRKARLRELIELRCDGSIAQMARDIGIAESYLGRMLYAPGKPHGRSVADKMMLKIEGFYDLPRGWLDLPSETPININSGGRFVAKLEDGPASHSEIRWPFKVAQYQRILQLRKKLGTVLGAKAIAEMDEHLDIILAKWERTAERNERARAS